MNPLEQHLIEIQALEPVEEQKVEIENESVNVDLFISGPILVFFGLFIGGFVYITWKRLREMRTVFAAVAIALLVGTLPMVMRGAGQKTSVSTKASPDLTPTEVVLSQVDTDTLMVRFETVKPANAAVKISETQDMLVGTLVFRDDKVTTEHVVEVTGLEPGMTYYMEILTDNQWYHKHGEPIMVTIN